MTDKKKFLEDMGEVTGNDYVIAGETALSMVDVLLEIALAFLDAHEVKARVDRLAASQANALASELEDQKFGKKN